MNGEEISLFCGHNEDSQKSLIFRGNMPKDISAINNSTNDIERDDKLLYPHHI